MSPLRPIVAVVLVSLLGSCGDHHGGSAGTPTGSTCPTTQTLTYATFGKTFFDTYCQTCHGSSVTGAARNGAPADHVFDQVEDIRLLAEHIDGLAAAGPSATNVEMPSQDPRPSEAQRRQLGEWLACGAP